VAGAANPPLYLGCKNPYEAPLPPEVMIDTTKVQGKEAAGMILKFIQGNVQ
jgi:adenylylsulfate kinase-like enzyme